MVARGLLRVTLDGDNTARCLNAAADYKQTKRLHGEDQNKTMRCYSN